MPRIGQHVAHLYRGIGATVTGYDPYTAPEGFPTAPLDELLTTSDVVSLHVPLTPDTSNLIPANVLERMPRSSVLVNVSRGGLIGEAALARALANGGIAGAAIDTFRHEPLDAHRPLWSAPNLIATPHIAWCSNRAVGRLQ